ncbi:MAG: cardiolipin synthase [Eubacteriales bacterium]|nr:cardiolipin synthase [Eubacteriales bacterium]
MKTQKTKNHLYKIIFSYKTLGFIFLMFQISFFVSGAFWLQEYAKYFYGVSTVLSLFGVIYVLNRDVNNSFKISWIILFALFPIMGILLSFLIHSNSMSKRQWIKLDNSVKKTYKYYKQNSEVANRIKVDEPELFSCSNYLNKIGGFSTYACEKAEYFDSGEAFFEELIKQLSKANKYIFIESYIVSKGYFYDKVISILRKKAKEGVIIKFIYDGIGTIAQFDKEDITYLRNEGIDCRVFEPLKPFLSSSQNNRDHRKIFVIDGTTAFTGGVNIADEYINKINRFGHWKDSAIMIKGASVVSFTAMFLQLWDMMDPNDSDYNEFFIVEHKQPELHDGYIIPYCDNPIDNEPIGKNVYLQIINTANNYVHIMTPYLILDDDMLSSLKLAAKRGVDVKIIMPGIPDKWYAYLLAKTFYPELISSGVRIYEYTPGFVHSKIMVSDGIKAVVGTINLDFRSLYHHYECAAFLYKSSVIKDISSDCEQTLKKCTKIFIEDYKRLSVITRGIGRILRILAPLM